MRYCLNPHCSNPRNPDDTEVCYACSTKLLLSERYRAIKLIGQGGFGRTFLAADDAKPSKLLCVIKQFYPDGQTNARAAIQLFEQEALRLQQVGEHPQIPDFYAHLEQDNHQYIIQEFIDGQNLAQELAENGNFNEDKIINLLKNLLPVIKFIQAGEIIHRDIKPDNIIRSTQQGQLFLVDFGAAKYATATALAKTGTIIGSAEFIAPEQLRGKATFASDIYSLGVTCIYLLTGVSPFNLFDINEDIWVWKDYLVDNPISDQLGGILDKMIQNSLKERYRCVEEIMTDLKMPLSPANPLTISTNQPPQKWQCIQTLTGHSASVTCIAFSPDGNLLASGSQDSAIKLWSLKTGQEISNLTGHTEQITCVSFSPNGQFIASSGWDGSILIYNRQTRQIIYSITGHDNWVSCLAFSPDNQVLVSGSFDKTIKIWNLKNGKQIDTIKSPGYQNWVTYCCFHPHLPILASGHGDNAIHLWDLTSKKKFSSFIGHISSITCLVFSPNGQILVSGSGDKTIKIWLVKSGKKLNSLSNYLDRINSIAFSPDGHILASASTDETITLWYLDQQSWQLLKEDGMITLQGHSQSVRAVAFSPDGKLLASSSDDGTIKLWQ